MKTMPFVAVVAVSAAAVAPSAWAAARPTGATFTRLPLSFEANRGQTAPEVRFLARGPGYTLFLTAGEAVLALQTDRDASPAERTVVRMRIAKPSAGSRMEGLEELPGRVNYFRGRDRNRWQSNVPTYRRVAWREAYPGIDVVFYGNQQQLEYDFVVAPGGDPRAIRLSFDGATAVRVDPLGDLRLEAGGREIVQRAPVVYQGPASARALVPARYVVHGQEIGIAVGDYDASQPLVIDPVLVYSTFLGGSAWDLIRGLAVDGDGYAYVTGHTTSIDFPNTFGAVGSGSDSFVSKLDPKGQSLIYSTYLGGGWTTAIAVDSSGNAYVTGAATATFPATPGAFQTVLAGGTDAFVARLDPSGANLDYATYLGGGANDHGLGIAVDGAENAYVTGLTESLSFPILNPFQAAYGGGPSDGFVARLERSGGALIYSSYLGAEGDDGGMGIALDPADSAYVSGYSNSDVVPRAFPQCATRGAFDAIVLKVEAAGGLAYARCVGGRSSEFGRAIAVDVTGSAFVAGDTFSSNFPLLNPIQAANAGVYDAFVFQLKPSGAAFVYSTYLGGTSWDHAFSIAVDDKGFAYVAGTTLSANFPVLNPLQGYAGLGDAFVAKVHPGGAALVYSTFLGGSDSEDFGFGSFVGVDKKYEAYVAGSTLSANFPLAQPLQAAHASPGLFDGFVARLH